MLSSSTSLAAAELAFYLVVTPIAVYVLICHGKRGIAGWLYLLIFIGIQLASAGIQISDRKKPNGSSGTAILGSIGLSPQLLAIAGILHEANQYLLLFPKKPLLAFYIFFHGIVSGAVALSASGASQAVSSDPKPSNFILWKIGSLLITICWLIIICWAVMSFRATRGKGSWVLPLSLVQCSIFALPFLGVRSIFGIVYTFQQNISSLAPQSLLERILCIFVPQAIVLICLLFGGIMTRNMQRIASTNERVQNTAAANARDDYRGMEAGESLLMAPVRK